VILERYAYQEHRYTYECPFVLELYPTHDPFLSIAQALEEDQAQENLRIDALARERMPSYLGYMFVINIAAVPI